MRRSSRHIAETRSPLKGAWHPEINRLWSAALERRARAACVSDASIESPHIESVGCSKGQGAALLP
jgi:hypothetical protein